MAADSWLHAAKNAPLWAIREYKLELMVALEHGIETPRDVTERFKAKWRDKPEALWSKCEKPNGSG